MAVISVAGVRSAMPAGRSSIVTATWRSGFAVWAAVEVEKRESAQITARKTGGFIKFPWARRAITTKDTKVHEGRLNVNCSQGVLEHGQPRTTRRIPSSSLRAGSGLRLKNGFAQDHAPWARRAITTKDTKVHEGRLNVNCSQGVLEHGQPRTTRKIPSSSLGAGSA